MRIILPYFAGSSSSVLNVCKTLYAFLVWAIGVQSILLLELYMLVISSTVGVEMWKSWIQWLACNWHAPPFKFTEVNCKTPIDFRSVHKWGMCAFVVLSLCVHSWSFTRGPASKSSIFKISPSSSANFLSNLFKSLGQVRKKHQLIDLHRNQWNWAHLSQWWIWLPPLLDS